QPRIRIGEEAAPVSERTQHALDEQAEHEATMAEQAANKNPKAAPHVSEPVAPPASEQPSRFKFGEEKNVQGEEIAAAPKKGGGKAPPTPAEAAEEAWQNAKGHTTLSEKEFKAKFNDGLRLDPDADNPRWERPGGRKAPENTDVTNWSKEKV